MASRRTSLIAVSAAIAALAGGGLYLAKAMTWVSAPTLAQAPMNIVSQVAPAFIMALDNSGSMRTDETLFPTSNGRGYFNTTTLSFFNVATGAQLTGGTAVPFTHMTGTGGWDADTYAPLRSPEFNRAYFDPHATYTPWLKADETSDADSPVNAATADPRGSCSPNRCASYTTFNFTTTQTVTETWRAGSVMPAGTEYWNDQACNTPSWPITNGWRTLTADITFSVACTTQFKYYPARVYLSLATDPPDGYDLSKRVLIKGVGKPVSGVKTDMWRYDIIAANFTTGGAAAAQNFANWWTYYGNRNRAMIAGITNSLKGLTNMRVGAFPFVDPPALATNQTMYDMAQTTDRATLIGNIRNLNAGGGSTPSRRGTAYMLNQFKRTDAGAPIKHQCQRNAAMLFTDGYTNESNQAAIATYFNVGDQDNTLGAPYGGAPYSGGVASQNTIADYAMWGYLTNPRPGLPLGEVPVPSSCSGTPAPGTDCNPNQHVNFYGVTLGAIGQIYGVNAAATADPYTTTPVWQTSSTDNLNARNVDDIWHASLNGRGEFINAKTPKEISDAMKRIITSVGEGATLSGTLGVKGTRIGSGSMSVEPSYEVTNNRTDWFGELTAYTLATTTSVVAGKNVTTVTTTEEWKANDKMPSPGDRKILYGAVVSGTVKDMNFDTTNITAMNQLCNGSDPLASCVITDLTALASVPNAVNYLRGDQTITGLRTRSKVLGDIINSSPVVSIPTDDYGYGLLDSSYATYLASKKSTNRPLVFVGANDGMFHVFDGRTSGSGGAEIYAYIPATSVGHMGNMLYPYDPIDKTNQKFQHRYFVDGPVTVSDIKVGGAWKTIAVGTSGAGGKSVFALDVTNPSSPSFLWEVNNLVGSHANNMGYVLGKPVIVPVKASATDPGSWKVIFGNGYNSTAQSATLFVVDAWTGAVDTEIAAESPLPTGGYNGLGNISVVDRQYFGSTGPAVDGRDGYADTVYAADQNGAVWKFDLTGTISVDRGGMPLFIAQDATSKRQAILGGLTVAPGTGGGVFVYFGSGSFSFDGDGTVADAESLYGILDLDTLAHPVTGTVTRAGLIGQATGAQFTSGGHEYLQTTSTAPTGAYGWYLDLPTKQRFVGNPTIANGVVFFPVYKPDVSATDDCTTPGENWLYGLNAFTGAAALSDVRLDSPSGTQPGSGTGAIKLDTNPATSAPIKDVALLTTPRPVPCAAGDTACFANPPLEGCYLAVQAPGAPLMYLSRPCGRQSWRQVR
ncbi:MAG: PilC/PilY family type IV pilus protein [Pseudoxanthomonas sp.]